jgi:hypothetical protein
MNTKIKSHSRFKVLVIVCLLSLITLPVLAQSGGGYDLSWNTVDGGGGSSSGGIFSLAGTAGQPDVGVMSGGEFSLAGGFWGGGAVTNPQIQLYLPVIVK